MAGPTSDWNTVIQSDVYGDAIYKSDAYKLDVFGNTTYPVLLSAFNGNNIYFRVLLNGSTGDFTGNQKDFKFFIGIDADLDNDIDFFIYLERDKNKENNDYSSKNYIGFWETDSGNQQKPRTTSWKSEDFIGSNDRYLSNSSINTDISGSGLNDHYYDFGFPLSELQDFISSDFPNFDASTTVNLIAFSAQGGDDDLDDADRKDILGIDDRTIQSGNSYSSSYYWSSLFVTNSLDGFSGNGDNTAPNLTQVTAITTPSNNTTPSYVFTTDEAGTISTSISQGFSTSSSASTGSDQTIIFNTLPEGTYSGKTITVTDTAGNAGSITIPDFVIDTAAPTFTVDGNSSDYATSVELGASYSAGTIANIVDESSTTQAVGGDTVNTNTAGTYSVTYTVTDAASNATVITETVTVSDTTDPTFTVDGNSSDYATSVELGASYSAGTIANIVDESSTTQAVGGDTVNTNTAGTYSVTYTVTDAASNATVITETVTVSDTTDPTFTVDGNSSDYATSVELGASYSAGTIANIVDESSTTQAVGGDTVNTNTAGTYSVTYTVTDAASNATVITETVTVSDTTDPTFTVDGNSSDYATSVELGASYSAGTIANIVDESSTTQAVGGDTVNTNTAGTYSVTYTVTDAASNATVITETVTVSDTTDPTFTVDGNSSDYATSVELGASYSAGTIANIVDESSTTQAVGGDTVNTNTAGTYSVTYTVTDAASNATVITETVTVSDTTDPTFTVDGNSSDYATSVELGASYSAGTIANIVDESSTTQAVGGDTVNTNTAGTYSVTYTVTDAASNATVITETVTVSDTTDPTFTVDGNSSDYATSVELGASYSAGTIANIVDESSTTQAVGGDTVNTNTAGTYSVTYTVTDAASNATVITETVTVSDTTDPTFTVDGNSSDYATSVELGASYSAGTIANIVDESSTTQAVGGDTVNTNTAGTYSVTYTVTDAASNATVITETVTVSDTTDPTFTVDGNSSDYATSVELGASYSAGTIANIVDESSTTQAVGGDTVNTNTAGTYSVTYTVTDAASNATVITETVTVSDTTDPTFTVDGNSSDYATSVELGASYSAGTIANIVDESSTTQAVGGDTVNTNTAGTYSVTYTVTDAASNATVITETVTVSDTTDPTFTVDGNSSDYATSVELGASYSAGTIANIVDESSTTQAVGGDTVNTNTAGTYSVTYTVTDAASNATVITETVTVSDTTDPTFTVDGNSSDYATSVELGASYSAGTIANIVDESSTTQAVGGDTVNTNTAGTYSVTYTVTDAASNATVITETVTVSDTTDPTFYGRWKLF